MISGENLRFHHVGVAVQRIADSVSLLQGLAGATLEGGPVTDPQQGVNIQFLRLGDLRVELLEPAAAPSPLDGILKRGISLYHVCYEVDDLESQLDSMVSAGARLVSPPKPAVAFNQRRVAFVMAQNLMIELLETRAS